MRTQTRGSVALALMVAALVVGCSDGTARNPILTSPPPQTPLAPTPTPTPQPPAQIYSVSGVVFEVTSAGNTPAEGVEVYCEPCGPPLGHSGRFTDRQGRFSFDGEAGGMLAGVLDLYLAKQGYVLPDQPDESGPNGLGWMGKLRVTVTGNTHFNIQIVRK
jgi:hypothetical protein